MTPVMVADRRGRFEQDGLYSSQGMLSGLQFADADKKFYSAKAKIKGLKSLEVWSDSVVTPAVVRYGWSKGEIEASLFNNSTLPASSFIADVW